MNEHNDTTHNPQAGFLPPDGDAPASRRAETPEEQEHAYRQHVARRREHLAAHLTPQTLAYMEEEFQTHLPCYQTRDPLTGQPIKPDPIAAAIRDGQREVILWLRHEIAMHQRTAPLP